MGELVKGSAFWSSDRPRRRCEDCGTPVRWGTLPDLVGRMPESDLAMMAAFVPPSGSVYWCPSCGMCGPFSDVLIA